MVFAHSFFFAAEGMYRRDLALSYGLRMIELVPDLFQGAWNLSGLYPQADRAGNSCIRCRIVIQLSSCLLTYLLAPSELLNRACMLRRSFLKERPNDARALLRKARILSELGRRDEAIDTYRQSIKRDPFGTFESPNWEALASALISSGQWGEARAVVNTSAQHDSFPKEMTAALSDTRLSSVLIALHKYDEARATLDSTITKWPSFAPALKERGELEYSFVEQSNYWQVDKPTVRSWALRALRLDPENVEYVMFAAKTYGETDRALTILRSVSSNAQNRAVLFEFI